MVNQVAELADSLQQEVRDFLRDIIAIPSFTGKEGVVIERIKKTMVEIGYDQVSVDAMGNLMGRIGDGDRILALDGHCDTVGIGELSTWKVDPFKGALRDDTVFGRGAVDQKGGLAAAVYAGKIVKEVGLPRDVSLCVVASVMEEDAEGLSWQHIIDSGNISPEAVILTEPTNLMINLGHRGRMEIEIQTPGVSCHGSQPELGENAIYKLAPIIEDIEKLNDALKTDSILGKGSVTVTEVRSAAPSLCAVPDSAQLHLDRRLTMGETKQSALKEISELPSVKTSDSKVLVPKYDITSHNGAKFSFTAHFPPWTIEKSHPLVIKAIKIYSEQFGDPAPIGYWKFSTNGVATKGIHQIPTIGFGPGKEEHAHTPREQVKASDLVDAMAFYAAFALAL